MGEYLTYVCIDKTGKVVARCCPLHGFGGMKWGEFVGTPAGQRLLLLLQEEFCEAGDADGESWVSMDSLARR